MAPAIAPPMTDPMANKWQTNGTNTSTYLRKYQHSPKCQSSFKEIGLNFQPVVTQVPREDNDDWMAERTPMPIQENQARALAYLLHAIRPEWGIDSIVTVLDRNQAHADDLAALIIATTNAARDPETKTPGRVFQITHHWPNDIKRRLPKPPPCPDHIGEDAHTCRCCHADTKVGLRPPSMIGKHWNPAAGWDVPNIGQANS